MAEPDQSTRPKKKSAGASLVVWILMGMLVVGLGGFGVTNFGGGVTTIGSVGGREITTSEYARALQQELNAISAQAGTQVTFQQAQALGLDRRALETLVARTALDAEAARLGLSVGDATVANAIMQIPAFQGVAGTFDREAYSFALDRTNITQPDFERGVREDEARTVLQGAIVGGFVAPAAITDTLYAYIGERRGFSLLRLTGADLTAPLPPPTEADLTAFHTTNIAQFTRPEAKRITYAALLPEMVAPDMEVDEAALRAVYDERIDEFVVPERRLVERLVFPTDAEAAAAKARLDAGESFEALVADRDLTLEDVDLGDVGPEELGNAATAVFALTAPGVVGPLPSDLGPALFRMNGILAAQNTSFEAARDSLAAEQKTDAARRAISDKVEQIDDLLAGGAALEDLVKEVGMELGTVNHVVGATVDSPLEGYPAFREAADKIASGDFPEAIALDDGGLVALRLDEIVPPTPIPFDEAREAVTLAWQADALTRALSARAIEIKAQVEAGATLASLGTVEVTPEIAREGFVEGAPADLVPGVFQMSPGDVRVFEAPDFAGIVVLDTISPARTDSEDATALRDSLAAQVEQALSQDAFSAFIAALQAEMGITLDQAAINAVHAQFN